MGGGGISEAKDPTIRTSPTDIIQVCSADEYATITYQGVECKATTDTWANECNTPSDCCSSGEFLKITPEGLQCFSKTNTTSTYTTFCADCCTTGEFAVITTLGLRCAGKGCTTDTECTTPLPYCDPTINRCVQCTKDTHCPGDENYCLNNKCEKCTWDTDYSCNTELTKRVKHCKLTDGTIKKTKILSCSSSQVCKGNQCVTPANCTATTATWTHHTRTCTAPLPATNHKQTTTVTDTTDPDTGTATFKCWDGTFTNQYSGCGTSCAAVTTQTWTQGSNSCSAALAQGIHGEIITITDTVFDPNVGSATYLCTNGVWSNTTSSCAPCAPRWVTGSWGTCSVDDSGCSGPSGTRTRTVTCKCGGATVPDNSCTQSKPTTSESCGGCGYGYLCYNNTCVYPEWRTSSAGCSCASWSACSNETRSCTSAPDQTGSVYCHPTYNDNDCSGSKPSDPITDCSHLLGITMSCGRSCQGHPSWSGTNWELCFPYSDAQHGGTVHGYCTACPSGASAICYTTCDNSRWEDNSGNNCGARQNQPC